MEDQTLIAKLREKGFRATPQRLAICDYVLSSKEHPTVDRVYNAVLKEHPTLSLATVYQTLHLLAEGGMLQELGFSGGVARYDPESAPHIHIVCRGCGKIEDFESERARSFVSQIAAEIDREPVGQRLEVHIYCDRCKAGKS